MKLTKELLKESVIVFDLDDTLYNEFDYRNSGFRAVANWMNTTYSVDLDDVLNRLISENHSDVLGSLCKAVGLPESTKESLLWVYRLHNPNIILSSSVKKTINNLERSSAGIAILTDGRSITQRLKIKALGISRFPLYISEELSDEKPSPFRFTKIMKDMPANKYIYVGDNPQKDFLAPNSLGWMTIGLIGNSKNIHSQEVELLPQEYHPKRWINCLSDLILD